MCPIKDWRGISSDRIEELTKISDEKRRQMEYEAATRLKTQNKNSSVIGRGVAGAIIAGPTGAVVGALSAIDNNMKNNK